jgi:CBS domain-containing protein
MRINELMSRNVTTIEQSATCHDAVGQMHRARVRHLPVVDAGRRLVGIITDRDLRHRLFTPAVMSAPVVTVRPDAELADAARLMLEDKVGLVPVVGDDGRVVGIVTETDLLRRIMQADDLASPEVDIIVSYP